MPRASSGDDCAARYRLAPLIDGNWGVPMLHGLVIFLEGRHEYNADARVAAE